MIFVPEHGHVYFGTVSFPYRLPLGDRLLPAQEWSCAKSKFTESQIVGMLKEAEAGVPVADRHGVSRASFFLWRRKYAGASVTDVKRWRELEAENAKLKRMYADLALENAAIKDVLPENCNAICEATGGGGARRRASDVGAAGLSHREALADGVLSASSASLAAEHVARDDGRLCRPDHAGRPFHDRSELTPRD